MPRLRKNDLYKKEQDEIVQQMIEILELDEDNSFTLYELDHNVEKQQAIMNLKEDIKKYFSLGNFSVMSRPQVIKKPYLSLVKNVLKQRYQIKSIERRKDSIQTIRYYLS